MNADTRPSFPRIGRRANLTGNEPQETNRCHA
jgi:hypothetical protein